MANMDQHEKRRMGRQQGAGNVLYTLSVLFVELWRWDVDLDER
jgi:hypothetical protein